MIIENIKVNNFGPFYSSHEIIFENNGYGVHVIRGNNGQGKTSVQQAIIWVLYGSVTNRKGKEIPITSLINRSAVSEYILNMEVKLFFEHEEKNYILTRKTQGKYHRNKDYEKNMSIYLVIDGEPQPNPQLLINRIIPPEVYRFFFFDGEMLRDYEELLEENSASMKLLRNNVEYVLGIPYLTLARDDLKSVKNNFENEKSKLLRKIGDEDYEKLAEKLEKTNREIERIETLITKMSVQYDELEREMSDKKRSLTDYEEVKKSAMERIKLEGEIVKLELSENEIFQKNKELTAALYKTILIDVSNNIIQQLEIKHEEVMGKYNKKQQLIRHLSDVKNAIINKECKLCGTQLLDPKKIEELESDKKITQEQINSLTEIPEPNLEYDTSIKILEKMIKKPINRNEYKKNDETLFKISHELAKKRARLSEIEKQLENIDQEEPFRIEKEIRKMQEELLRLEYEMKDINEDLKKELIKKSEIDQKLKSINQTDIIKLNNRIEVSNGLMKLFETSISTYREQRRKDVEKIATDIFKNIRSKTDFESLYINENFGLSIITSKGNKLDKSEWRSAGEEQIVALSLIGALNKCAQIKAPIFMDTPFGRLDKKHGERVLKYIPSLSEQVVILVTDREFSLEDEEHLKGSIITDYTLIHRGEDRGTHVLKTSTFGGS